MKNNFILIKNYVARGRNGFILPFTMLITTIVLFIMTSTMSLLSKQMYFSKLYKQSQAAYYAADDAATCALAIDDTYIGDDGLGIFPSSNVVDSDGSLSLAYMQNVLLELQGRDPVFASLSSIDEIKCAQALVFNTASTSKFMVSPINYVFTFRYPDNSIGTEEGKSSTYTMRMPISSTESRCAKVTINKTASFRQIVAQGYAACDGNASAVERAVVMETVTQ
jgi:hypothetical protein